MRKVLFPLLGILPLSLPAEPLDVTLKSPDKSIEARVWADEKSELRWELRRNGVTVVEPGRLGLVIDGKDLGQGVALVGVEKTSTDRTYAFRGGKAQATDRSEGVILRLRSGETDWRLEARASDDGFAFRSIVEGEGRRLVNGESSEFRLPPGTVVWYGERDTPYKLRTYAVEYRSAKIEEMMKVSSQGPVQLPPLVFETGGVYGLVTEAGSFDYSGMRLRAVDAQTFRPDFTEGAKGFALEGRVVTPWRVFICVDSLDALVNSTLVDNLAPLPDPELFADTSYIKPGRSVWRWHLRWVGSPEDQKRYVDFATKLGYQYSIVDEGWAGWPKGSLEGLCQYAKERNVGIFVWKRWPDVSDPADNYAKLRAWLDEVKAAGVAGVKVDFFDSEALEYRRGEEAVLREAARRRLMVNFHGCPKPTGESIRYPNEITREAVRGLELNYMTEAKLPPSHNAALPFTRYVAGPGDYTPVTFLADHLYGTTVAQQLATAVCLTSPMLIINAFPEEILNHKVPAVTAFLKAVPSVWDETRVLPGSKIGDLAVMARRSGDRWFVAAMNGGGARTYTLTGDFLGGKTMGGSLIVDGGSPTEVTSREITLGPGKAEEIALAPGGGFVVMLEPR